MAAGTVNFTGTWKEDRSENLDDFLQEAGMGFIKRKVAGNVKPTQDITQDGDTFTVHLKVGNIDNTITFKIGEEFSAKAPGGGRDMKCLASWEGTKLIVTSTPVDASIKKVQKTTREIINDELVQKMEVGDVVCTRYFKRA